MIRKSTRFRLSKKVYACASILLVVTNCYLLLHLAHVDLQPSTKLLKIAARRLRDQNSSVTPSPLPDVLMEPLLTNGSYLLESRDPNQSSSVENGLVSKQNISSGPLSTSWEWEQIVEFLRAAFDIFDQRQVLRHFDHPIRCPGNLSCNNFSESFSIKSWNSWKTRHKGFRRCPRIYAHTAIQTRACTHTTQYGQSTPKSTLRIQTSTRAHARARTRTRRRTRRHTFSHAELRDVSLSLSLSLSSLY